MKLQTGLLYLVARFRVLLAIRRHSIGSPDLTEDRLPLASIPSVAHRDSEDRVLAEIDQDGFAFPVDSLDLAVFKSKPTMTPRRHHRIQIVLRDKRVLVRKTAVPKADLRGVDRVRSFLKWDFYIEAAALLRLQALECVPTLRRIDIREEAIEMDYIWGRDLRQILAKGAADIPYDEISRSFSTLAARGGKGDVWEQVANVVANIVQCGVIPRDVHAANFILGHQSKKVYMIDFNLAYFYPVPGWQSHANTLNWLFKDRCAEPEFVETR